MIRGKAPGCAALALSTLMMVGCGRPRPPSEWRHACIAYNPGRDAVDPIGGYPLSVLDDGWRHHGGGLTMDRLNVMVLNADVALTRQHMVVRMAVQRAPDGPKSDQCGPGYLLVSAMSVDGEVQDSVNLERSLEILLAAAAQHLGVKEPVFPPDPSTSVAAPVPNPASPPAANAGAALTPSPAGAALVENGNVSVDPAGTNRGDSDAALARADRQAAERAQAEAVRQQELQRARQQAIAACRAPYDEAYASYNAHLDQEHGAAVTQASVARNACMAEVRQRLGGTAY